jgi:hypothetical protein
MQLFINKQQTSAQLCEVDNCYLLIESCSNAATNGIEHLSTCQGSDWVEL